MISPHFRNGKLGRVELPQILGLPAKVRRFLGDQIGLERGWFLIMRGIHGVLLSPARRPAL